jgi:hypothetical protein
MFDRELFARSGLRYDETLDETEDYDLWSRALRLSDGDNLGEPHLLYRIHPQQASQRNRPTQSAIQQRVSLDTIQNELPTITPTVAEAAFGFANASHWGGGESGPNAYLAVLDAFGRKHVDNAELPAVRRAAARHVIRLLVTRPLVLSRVLTSLPSFGAGAALEGFQLKTARRLARRRRRRRAVSALDALGLTSP